eukprot:CAMPEP_0205917108 /NCGR_PEP_ID=MMETSP1325-20131115/8944_1 /ASSEMBLY_ACC=CAM_ASM_000708 /TAXON_ID=236786 /ORGANISM="Florenciella sp., Strain RCC1007" /LENGTH=422 /DNA_ID=CAMNT_0053284481 /DNA_START=42 /DNA_END=1310 /DNA_ORIENTATION=-
MVVPYLRLDPPTTAESSSSTSPHQRLRLEISDRLRDKLEVGGGTKSFVGFGYEGGIVSESELPPLDRQPDAHSDASLPSAPRWDDDTAEKYHKTLQPLMDEDVGKHRQKAAEFMQSLMSEDVGKLRQKAAKYAEKASRPTCPTAARDNWLLMEARMLGQAAVAEVLQSGGSPEEVESVIRAHDPERGRRGGSGTDDGGLAVKIDEFRPAELSAPTTADGGGGGSANGESGVATPTKSGGLIRQLQDMSQKIPSPPSGGSASVSTSTTTSATSSASPSISVIIPPPPLASVEEEEFEPSAAELAMLCDMGFEETLSKAALKRSNNDVTGAIDILMNGDVGDAMDDTYSDMPPLAPADEDDDGPYATTGYATSGSGGVYPASGFVSDFSDRSDIPSNLRWKCKVCGQMNPLIVEGCGECNAPHV